MDPRLKPMDKRLDELKSIMNKAESISTEELRRITLKMVEKKAKEKGSEIDGSIPQIVGTSKAIFGYILRENVIGEALLKEVKEENKRDIADRQKLEYLKSNMKASVNTAGPKQLYAVIKSLQHGFFIPPNGAKIIPLKADSTTRDPNYGI